MNNISSLSTEELKRISSGGNSSPISSMDTEELKRIAGGQKHEASFGENLAGLAKGAISGIGGGGADLLSNIYNIPASLHNASIRAAEQNPEMFRGTEYERIPGAAVPTEIPTIPSAVHGIEHGIENVTNIKTPTDPFWRNIYEGLKFAGELAGTGGIGKIAGKAGMKGLEKIGTTLGTTAPSHLVGATGAGATLHKLGEEYGPEVSLPATIAAGALGTKGAHLIGKTSKGLKGTLTGKGETLGEMTVGQALSKLGKPSTAIENTARKEGFKLPFNIRLQGPVSNFLANTGLNTVFKSQKYTDLIENAPKDVMKSVVKRIDEIHPENMGSQAASKEAEQLILKEQNEVEDNAKRIYEIGESYLTDADKVNISPVVKTLRELRNDLSAPVPSEPMKFVINRVEKLADAWGITKPTDLRLGKQKLKESDLGNYNNLLKMIGEKAPEIPVRELIQQRSAFMNDLRNKDAYGAQRQLNRLIKALDESINTTTNKEFLNHWRAGNDYFKNEVVNRVRGDVARSLTEGTFPKQAYDYMSSPEKINELQRILGKSSNAEQVVNSLKRAKLQDVLMSRITNADGSIRFGAFADMFEKGNKQQDLMKSLLGDKPYNDLKEISKIASTYSKAGKEFANPSGTATRAQDIGKIMLGLSAIPAGFAGGLGAGAATAGTAALYSGTPYLLSRILSNPRYTDSAVKYALARQAGKNGSEYQNKLRSIFLDTAKKYPSPVINKENQD